MDTARIKETIGNYREKKREYNKNCNKIREEEWTGKKYPWDADAEIKDLDEDFKSSAEKKDYDGLRNKADSDSNLQEVFEKTHTEVYFPSN